ncbi:SIMPL domain-containing protein [Micromonospora sp. ALFpr18c]|uniref:SIMPL domain-containing protein n=1 Tax=unclassified Micromonospora TaxID=2617518 RepID=UPI00124BAF65|nr:SIMPL domain-containing protein [Micromonospora sp. ALFpr18c]KAB1939805.1 SIMPL domain-containing protein [Micromonospora sp. ALFpr18c]
MAVDGPVVQVRGEAYREVPPELARFAVTATARDRDREATLTRLAERAAAVRVLLDGSGPVVARRETGDLRVRPETRRSGERVVAWHGSVTTTVTVTVTDFTALGELMLRLADQDQVEVAGPWWELRPDSPAHREARHAAIGDALLRAREYAEALGARVTALIELADAGPAERPMFARAAFGGAGGGGGAPELELDPQPQTVQAAVQARFTISDPVLG